VGAQHAVAQALQTTPIGGITIEGQKRRRTGPLLGEALSGVLPGDIEAAQQGSDSGMLAGAEGDTDGKLTTGSWHGFACEKQGAIASEFEREALRKLGEGATGASASTSCGLEARAGAKGKPGAPRAGDQQALPGDFLDSRVFCASKSIDTRLEDGINGEFTSPVATGLQLATHQYAGFTWRTEYFFKEPVATVGAIGSNRVAKRMPEWLRRALGLAMLLVTEGIAVGDEEFESIGSGTVKGGMVDFSENPLGQGEPDTTGTIQGRAEALAGPLTPG